ncbi:hypothetical protein M3G04_09770 [Dietzia cinnamea]|uniref:hypothetical protein n=1 Tax=Dietzia cinnamea TaxID=321318 RepID=UPI00223B1B08|nr:hypothetical protein [Dietzia cinnamea]MCT2301173.1 hypothetical protein [Dietzia cinnamea]
MNPYAHTLVEELHAAGYAAEAPWPTGGGCEQIRLQVGALELGITNGDAALPDGEVHDSLIAYVSARDADGDELDAVPLPPGGNIVDAVAQLIDRLT